MVAEISLCPLFHEIVVSPMLQQEKVPISLNGLPFIKQGRPFAFFNCQQLHLFDLFILSYRIIQIYPTY